LPRPAGDPVCVLRAEAACGESPVWAADEQALYWTDIPNRRIHRFEPASGATRAWSMPSEVGCLALRERGGLVVAMRGGFAFVDLGSGRVEPITDPEAGKEDNRFNDGRCDPQGRFWAGTMHEPRTRNDGALYRLDADLSCRRMAGGVMVSNGLAWSPDGRTMYHADSRGRVVWAWDFEPVTGEIANRRVFARTGADEGRPDGAAVDADGGYWSARYAGGRVVRHRPDGSIDRVIRLPVSKPTMCAFGGPGLDQLYVTSARERMTPEQLAREPLAGGIFRVDLDVRGLPEPRFRG
jgi:sugar lactone lactonase YvrE